MSSNSELIFLAEVKTKFSKEKTLEENCRIAMKEAKDHWLISQYNDEQKSFMSAILAVSNFYGIKSPEFEQIKAEMVFINATQFTPCNVPIDWAELLSQMPKDIKPIGLMKIWKEIKDE